MAECLRECPLMPLAKDDAEGDVVGGRVSGEGAFRGMSLEERAPATDLAAAFAGDTFGREKFWRLLVLLFACEVKLL